MKRIRMRPKVRKERRYDPLPLDPRDPDILRAEQLMDVRRSHHEGGEPCLRSGEMLRSTTRRANNPASLVLMAQYSIGDVAVPQHPDEHRPQRPILLAVDQEFAEGATLR